MFELFIQIFFLMVCKNQNPYELLIRLLESHDFSLTFGLLKSFLVQNNRLIDNLKSLLLIFKSFNLHLFLLHFLVILKESTNLLSYMIR